jgi:hypothetical protein
MSKVAFWPTHGRNVDGQKEKKKRGGTTFASIKTDLLCNFSLLFLLMSNPVSLQVPHLSSPLNKVTPDKRSGKLLWTNTQLLLKVS